MAGNNAGGEATPHPVPRLGACGKAAGQGTGPATARAIAVVSGQPRAFTRLEGANLPAGSKTFRQGTWKLDMTIETFRWRTGK